MRLTVDRIHEFSLKHGPVKVIANDIGTVEFPGPGDAYVVQQANAFYHGRKWHTRQEFEQLVDAALKKPTDQGGL